MPTPMLKRSPARAVQAANPAALPRFRCLHRPTGEWFTFAPGHPGAGVPDATALFTELEARRRLADIGFTPPIVEQTLAYARAHAEVSVDDDALPPAGI
jgi:hypothetical protein